MLPPLDQAVSAFLDDLEVHGLLDETLVVMVGEFGRTPKIGQSSTNDASQRTGRDHWAGVFSAVFAGGGVRGGRVIGKSDKIAAYPATRGYFPADSGRDDLPSARRRSRQPGPRPAIPPPPTQPRRANCGLVRQLLGVTNSSDSSIFDLALAESALGENNSGQGCARFVET